jgi:hypothetical protein
VNLEKSGKRLRPLLEILSALARMNVFPLRCPNARYGHTVTLGTARTESDTAALDSARRKAYWRLLPLLFICYVIAYVDRANVAIAKLTMTRDLPGFDNAVIGFGAGVFFIGYFLLEIPGTLLVEKWSARKWISRIMVTWGDHGRTHRHCEDPVAILRRPLLPGIG